MDCKHLGMYVRKRKKKILNDELKCAAAEEGITSFFLWPHPGITQ